MQSSNPIEPPIFLEKKASLDAKKISFEINRIKLPIGLEGTFGSIKHPGASLAVPITSNGRVVVLRQYRFAVSRRILEFPAGTLEKEESPLSSMQRELAEEAGYRANKWDSLGEMLPCPGYSDEVIHMFLARELNRIDSPPKGDADEDLEVILMTPNEFDSLLIDQNEALDGKSVAAWFRAKKILNL
tara:strand:- start:438 stop:998 length:561 start_codon:yes stop_codon:yes gene_type:complete